MNFVTQSARAMARMAKPGHIMALGCYLAIPAVVMVGSGLFQLIDPETARATADYAGNYRLLSAVANGVLMATAGLALILWAATCYLVLAARQRHWLWLALAAGGPIGFVAIGMLADRSPAPGDLHQRLLGGLKLYWRIPLEVVLFVSVSTFAVLCVDFMHDLRIRLESFATGIAIETLIAERDASSGMYAFSEGVEALYLLALAYLLWPMLFNLVATLRR